MPTILHVSAGAIIGSYTKEADYDSVVSFTNVYKNIHVSDYIEMSKDDNTHFVYIGRPTCDYCLLSQPLTKRISYEMNKDIYYINIDNETSTDLKLLAEVTDGIYKGATPLFIIVKAGKIIDSQEGAGSYDMLSSFFKGGNNQ